MTSKKHRMIIYGVAVQLLLIAIVCYAAFPVEAPKEEPIRLMYQASTGKVLFDHQIHASENGYGLACVDCHHPHPADEEAENISCGECHFPKPTPEKKGAGFKGMFHFGPLPKADENAKSEEGDDTPPPLYPTDEDNERNCLECHDESDFEDMEWLNKSAAIHKQCFDCHEEYEKGPTSSSEDCGKCHVR